MASLEGGRVSIINLAFPYKKKKKERKYSCSKKCSVIISLISNVFNELQAITLIEGGMCWLKRVKGRTLSCDPLMCSVRQQTEGAGHRGQLQEISPPWPFLCSMQPCYMVGSSSTPTFVSSKRGRVKKRHPSLAKHDTPGPFLMLSE